MRAGNPINQIGSGFFYRAVGRPLGLTPNAFGLFLSDLELRESDFLNRADHIEDLHTLRAHTQLHNMPPAGGGVRGRIRGRARAYVPPRRRGNGLNRAHVRTTLRNSRHIKRIKNRLEIVDDLAHHTFRRIDNHILNSGAVGAKNYSQIDMNNLTQLQASLANLRYYNPGTPGTLVNADGTTGTYSKQYFFNSISGKITMRNNTTAEGNVVVYVVVPRHSTSNSAQQAFAAGFNDQAANATYAVNHVCAFPTDSEQFNKHWRIVKIKKRHLKIGERFTVTHHINKFKYNDAHADDENDSYQPKYKSFAFLVGIYGDLMHGGTAPHDANFQRFAVDCITECTYKITYDGGARLSDFSVSDLRTATAGAGKQAMKPDVGYRDYALA